MFKRNTEAIWRSDRSTMFISLALLQIFSWFSSSIVHGSVMVLWRLLHSWTTSEQNNEHTTLIFSYTTRVRKWTVASLGITIKSNTIRPIRNCPCFISVFWIGNASGKGMLHSLDNRANFLRIHYIILVYFRRRFCPLWARNPGQTSVHSAPRNKTTFAAVSDRALSGSVLELE